MHQLQSKGHQRPVELSLNIFSLFENTFYLKYIAVFTNLHWSTFFPNSHYIVSSVSTRQPQEIDLWVQNFLQKWSLYFSYSRNVHHYV